MRLALRIAPAVLLAISACAVEGEPAPDLEETSLIMVNGLPPDVLLDSEDELSALAGGPLNGASTPLADSSDGQKLLTDLVRCALNSGSSASFRRSDGRSVSFPGLVGFAQGWKNNALDLTGQRLVTGCLIAHVNARGASFPISLRSSAIRGPNLIERLTMTAQEMAAYGNIFAPPGQRELFVCFGEAVAKSLGGSGGVDQELGLPNYLTFRVCAVDESPGRGCGFNLVGGCFRFQSDVTETACEQRPNGDIFKRCHKAPIEEQATPFLDETVSVFVNPADLGLQLSEYLEFVCVTTRICLDLPLPI
jgi:hypothetical protein